MKNLLIIIFVSLFIFSCKEELPSSVNGQLNSVNYFAQELNETDSIIWSLNDDEIGSLSSDSALRLISQHNTRRNLYQSSSDELDEIIKINPEYSDHEDIKNRRYHFVIESRIMGGMSKISDNLTKLDEQAFPSNNY
jgi:hypothetical protein